jgi:uncharacterized protein YraI
MTRNLVRAALFIFALTMSLSAFAATKSERENPPGGRIYREVRHYRLDRPS